MTRDTCVLKLLWRHCGRPRGPWSFRQWVRLVAAGAMPPWNLVQGRDPQGRPFLRTLAAGWLQRKGIV